MTSSPKKPKMPSELAQPSPQPSPAVVEEQLAAKEAVKRKGRKKGRGSTILAGRMMEQQILRTGDGGYLIR